MDSILDSIKKLLGINPDYTEFDVDIIVAINTALMSLDQIGLGARGFCILSNSETWADLLGDTKDYEAVKTYVFMKVKMMFDPPSSSYAMEALKSTIAEYEWRLLIRVDGGDILDE